MAVSQYDNSLRGEAEAGAPAPKPVHGSTCASRLTLYRLFHPDVIASPWSFYRRLRDEGVYFDPYLRCWLVARHADVATVLADARFSVAMHHEARIGPLVANDASVQQAMRYLDAHVSFVDDPDHARLRGVLSTPFRPAHVRLLDGLVSDVVVAAWQRLAARPDPDVVADVAAVVPLRVTQQMLGLTAVDVATLRRWSNAWGDVVAAPGHLPTAGRAQLMADVDALVDALTGLIADHQRRGRTGDTVTGALVRAVAAGVLSHDELVANLMMLVTAGNETTTNLISNTVLALLADDDLWCRLRDDRSQVPAAVEELMRVYPPTQYTARTARVDVRLGGQTVRAGQAVVLVLAAANRDPAVFADPDTVRLDRPAVARHLTFGRGPHFCFGAALARLETRRVLEVMLGRGRPERAGEPRWRLNGNLRGLASLPVRMPPGSPEAGNATTGHLRRR